MDPIVTSALIAGGTGLLGSLLQSNENSRQYARQQELLKLQQDYNTSMWNKTNAYNSPANQLALYEAANVNPNTAVDAISGVAHASQVATPAVPSISSTGSSASALINSIGTIADYLFKQKQSENLDAQNANLQAQTERQKIENKILEKDANVRDELNQLTLEQYRSNIQKTLADTDLSKRQTDELSYRLSELLPAMKEKTVAEREQIAVDIERGVVGLANDLKQGVYLDEKTKTERVTQGLIYYQSESQKYKAAVDALHAELAEKYNIDVSSSDIQMIVQASLSGDENAKRIIKTLTGTLSGAVSDEAIEAVSNVVPAGRVYSLRQLSRDLQPFSLRYRSTSSSLRSISSDTFPYRGHGGTFNVRIPVRLDGGRPFTSIFNP